jgi:hypothetical protein
MLGSVQDSKERSKQLKKLFDDYDMQTDSSKKDELFVFTNEELIASEPDLHIFSQHYSSKKTMSDLDKALSICMLGVFKPDFYST